jgi:hypothetical protein
VALRVLLLAAATAALAASVGPAVATGFGAVAGVTVALELRRT